MSPIVVLLGFLSVSSAWVIPHPMFGQYRSQDELGAYAFGYHGGPSSRAEVRDHFGIVRGAYNLIGADGEVQRVQYVSDALGYRLLTPTYYASLPAPEPVQETPEVLAAKEKLAAAYKSAADAAAAATAAAAEPAAPAEEPAAAVEAV